MIVNGYELKPGADLSKANLSWADLYKADLSGANLSWANLFGANLSGANLSGADLYQANLSGANLYRVDLSEADLTGADLTGASLSGASLREANLSGAGLREANLYKANLSGANLSEANLYKANLSGANLSEANLYKADLVRANLSEADLYKADLSEANLSGTCLDPSLELETDPIIHWIESNSIERDGDFFIAWRTKKSIHCGDTVYEPGEYSAPWFSADVSTECHPGLYFSTRDWLENEYSCELVRVRVNVHDCVVAASKTRCRKFVVLEG
jgi:uncharacterized protein YjbI with pentapeptide repeats